MTAPIYPFLHILDLVATPMDNPRDLIPLVERYMLAVEMGQLRDIKQRERLSRGICREYHSLFEAHDIVVLPSPLTTRQSDVRYLVPRRLVPYVSIPERASARSSSSDAIPEPCPRVRDPNRSWRGWFASMFAIALFALLAPLMPLDARPMIRRRAQLMVEGGARRSSRSQQGRQCLNQDGPDRRRWSRYGHSSSSTSEAQLRSLRSAPGAGRESKLAVLRTSRQRPRRGPEGADLVPGKFSWDQASKLRGSYGWIAGLAFGGDRELIAT